MFGVEVITVDVLPVAFAGDLDVLALAVISQIALPAPGRSDIQHKAVGIEIVEPGAGHGEMGRQLTLAELEVDPRAGIVHLETKRATVITSDRSRRKTIPVIELGQIVDLGFHGR